MESKLLLIGLCSVGLFGWGAIGGVVVGVVFGGSDATGFVCDDTGGEDNGNC